MRCGDAVTLTEILAIAKIHPFYASHIKYPPDEETIRIAREKAGENTAESDLKSAPVLWRSSL